MCRVHALTPFPTAGTWTVCVRAGIHTLMNIWRVFVLVVGALLLPLAAAGDGPANKVGISRGYGTLHCADRGGEGYWHRNRCLYQSTLLHGRSKTHTHIYIHHK